ncbi:hypothetical protein DOTSEDRAFT_79973 [Dothistroma septosporum NZE10]|uniref:DNA mismatch repair protein S5 domain-containing protein n=1 Tax=Dothistroma septosporum (strain NZE10 / CBS 128990) TaxID=675120 RepID=N1PMG3_DOTSN|nr:hypothetical protein DOTSEDRAFT_79973 [Dothistroma septosporum NZE10]
MGIEALPQTTVRALGATQVLTDPAAVVKELIDNALDANATSVAIEIHSNTLDIIQLRDNGNGIAPEDRPLVARRYCTSKISHDDELKDIGGSSLGFRGEALASAAELSGTLTISTRIGSEQTAAVLKINQLGEVAGQERGSLPVGTTVRITDFIKANPVRRQVCLKNSETNLKKIKRTLQAYAFARPNVRLSLRVLKAKNRKGDWIYAPKPNGNAEDAAFKIVGASCASQCTWSVLEHAGFTFEAFCPHPDSGPGKVNNIGSFVSLDRRPVSTARNTFKQIAKIYREALKGSNIRSADIKDPFLYLNISCPAASYDANLEPAKDDVVFEDPGKVVEVARLLFSAVYTPAVEPEMIPNVVVEKPVLPNHRAEGLDNEFTTIFDNQPQAQRTDESAQHDGPPIAGAGSTALLANPQGLDAAEKIEQPRRAFRSNMYGCDEEDMDLVDDRPPTARTEAEFEELRQARRDISTSNPWVLAKLNSSTRRPAEQQDTQSTPPQPFTSIKFSSSPAKYPSGRQDASAALLTPRPSSPSLAAETFHPSNHVPDIRLARDGRAVGSLSLPPPQPYTPVPSSDARFLEDAIQTFPLPAQPTDYGHSLHFGDPGGTPLEAIPDATTKPRHRPREQPQPGNVNKPFVPPVKSRQPPEQVWFDHLQDAESPPRRLDNKRRRHNADSSGLVAQGELGDLVDDPRLMTPPRRNRDIRDFVQRHATDYVASMIEGRNYAGAGAAMSQQGKQSTYRHTHEKAFFERRDFMPASELANLQARLGSPEKPAATPAKRHETSERRALQDLEPNAPTSRATQDDADEEWRLATDSRALSRRKSSRRLGRAKSSKLPLEHVPAGQGTHNLFFNTIMTLTNVSRLAGKLDEEKSLLGYNQPALDPPGIFQSEALDIHDLTNSLHDLLIKTGSDRDPPAIDSLFKELQTAFAHDTATGIEDEVMSSA